MGPCVSKPHELDGPLNLNYFDMGIILGEGAFGKVRRVVHRVTKQQYALKYISKDLVAKKGCAGALIRERRALEELQHPFICNLRYAFQDREHCFLVLDLMMGGSVGYHLTRRVIDPEFARLWIAEVAIAIAFLHSKNVMHRDIKPDNILTDMNMHAHLGDFGLATSYKPNTLRTDASGSWYYAAPEVLALAKDREDKSTTSKSSTSRPPSVAGPPIQRGYDESIDWWGLGATAYHLIYGRMPFKASSIRHLALMAAEGLPEPSARRMRYVATDDAVDLVENLMTVSPRQRLRYSTSETPGARNMRSHPYFASIDWNRLPEKSKDATPHSAQYAEAMSGTYAFDQELDEYLGPHNPLPSYKKPKKDVDATKIAPAIQRLENEFHDYDYTTAKQGPSPMVEDIGSG